MTRARAGPSSSCCHCHPTGATGGARGPPEPPNRGAGRQSVHTPGLLLSGTDGHGTRRTCSPVMPGSGGDALEASGGVSRRAAAWFAMGRAAATGPGDGIAVAALCRLNPSPRRSHAGAASFPQPPPAGLALAVPPVSPGSVGHPHRPTHGGCPAVGPLLQHRATASRCLPLRAFPFPAANGTAAPLAQPPAQPRCHRCAREPAATSSPNRGRPRAGQRRPGRSLRVFAGSRDALVKPHTVISDAYARIATTH